MTSTETTIRQATLILTLTLTLPLPLPLPPLTMTTTEMLLAKKILII